MGLFFFGPDLTYCDSRGKNWSEAGTAFQIRLPSIGTANVCQGATTCTTETGQKQGWWQTYLPISSLGCWSIWEQELYGRLYLQQPSGGNRGISRLSLNGDPSNGQQVGSTGGTGQGSALRVLTQIWRCPFLKVPVPSIWTHQLRLFLRGSTVGFVLNTLSNLQLSTEFSSCANWQLPWVPWLGNEGWPAQGKQSHC